MTRISTVNVMMMPEASLPLPKPDWALATVPRPGRGGGAGKLKAGIDGTGGGEMGKGEAGGGMTGGNRGGGGGSGGDGRR